MRTWMTVLMLLVPSLAFAQLEKQKPERPTHKLPLEAPKPTGDEAQRFEEAEAALKKFEALLSSMPKSLDAKTWGKAFSDLLVKQAHSMSDLQQRYAQLGNSAQPQFAVPALVRMGEVMEAYATSLEGMPLPTDLPAESLKAIRAGLKESGNGLRNFARGQYLSAVNRAGAGGVTGPWVEFAKARLKAIPRR